MCNHRIPATEESNKDQVVFRKYLRKHFTRYEKCKNYQVVREVFSGEFLRNVNRSHNPIFLNSI